MRIIKVDAIDSTNRFLKDLNRVQKLVKPVSVIAHEQLSGKGQMGTIWQSDPGKNLTCSVFMRVDDILLSDQFYISMVTSLAVFDVLKDFMVSKVSVKWPNDILSDRQKICGILIENIVKNGSLVGVIIGIGLNVNQTEFDQLPMAGSLKKIVGKNFDVNEVFNLLLKKIEKRFSELRVANYQLIKNEYESILFRKDKPSTFENIEGESFVGIIKGVNPEGKLQLLLEDEVVQTFGLKEIKLLY
ncbi:biotin--[acetyl-CoA-carboxylase] ligase [Aquimarina sp. 2201CG1-2-11]|uniref:biotin--[acetyl-CoA-carboxylase] ligase n=1 Tax=Aquimarina discodermiae TaxID=3231043 RepID=UPI0034631308